MPIELHSRFSYFPLSPFFFQIIGKLIVSDWEGLLIRSQAPLIFFIVFELLSEINFSIN